MAPTVIHIDDSDEETPKKPGGENKINHKLTRTATGDVDGDRDSTAGNDEESSESESSSQGTIIGTQQDGLMRKKSGSGSQGIEEDEDDGLEIISVNRGRTDWKRSDSTSSLLSTLPPSSPPTASNIASTSKQAFSKSQFDLDDEDDEAFMDFDLDEAVQFTSSQSQSRSQEMNTNGKGKSKGKEKTLGQDGYGSSGNGKRIWKIGSGLEDDSDEESEADIPKRVNVKGKGKAKVDEKNLGKEKGKGKKRDISASVSTTEDESAGSNPRKKRGKIGGNGITKAEEKRKEAEGRKMERERKKMEKEVEKQQKSMSRSVNVKIKSRKEALAEIRLVLPPSIWDCSTLTQSHPLKKLIGKIRKRFGDVLAEDEGSSQSASQSQPKPKVNSSDLVRLSDSEGPIEGLVRWVRKVNKAWDAERRCWIPLAVVDEKGVEEREEEEKMVMMVISASQLISWISDSSSLLLIRSIRSSLPPSTTFYLLISGLDKHYKLRSSAEKTMSGVNASKNADASKFLKDDELSAWNGPSQREVEKELVRLQEDDNDGAFLDCGEEDGGGGDGGGGVWIVKSEGDEETVRWMVELTMDLGFRPYKRLEKSWSSLVGDFAFRQSTTDRPQAGQDPTHTWILMLSSLGKGVTEEKARAIVKAYPTIRKLMEAYENCSSREQRGLLLAELTVPRNKDGTAHGGRLGPAASKRVATLFWERTDPDFLIPDRIDLKNW